jgi:hypothetical protein
MFQLQDTKPADALVSVQEAELKVTSVGSGTMTKLTSVEIEEAGAAGESVQAAASIMVHQIIRARPVLIML